LGEIARKRVEPPFEGWCQTVPNGAKANPTTESVWPAHSRMKDYTL